MADLNLIAQGFNILNKYSPTAEVEGGHDIIHICITEDEVADEADRDRLRALGFFIDSDADSTWAHY